MPEQLLVGSGSPEAKNPVLHSYPEYVRALSDKLHLTKDPSELYEKSATDLDAWLGSTAPVSGAPQITAELEVGPDTLYKKSPRQAVLHSDDPLPKSLDDLGKHSTERLGWYALAEAKLQFLADHYEDLPALRGFNLQTRRYDVRSQAEYYITHGSWKKDQTPIATKIKRGVLQGTAEAAMLVAAACGIPASASVPTEIAPGTQFPAPEVTPTGIITKDFITHSLENWKTFHYGTTNVVMTGEPVPFMDPTDATGKAPYVMQAKNPDGTTESYAFATAPIRATGATGLTKDYNMPALVRQDGKVFGLFQLPGTDPTMESFLVESRAPDGSLVTEPWAFEVVHNADGSFTYVKVTADRTDIGFKGVQANPALPTPDANVYNAVFHAPGVDVVPTLTPDAPATPEAPVRLPDDLEIVTDLTVSPEKIPFEDFQTFTSPLFVEKLIDMDKRGLLSKVSKDAEFLTPEQSIHYFSTDDPNYGPNGMHVLFKLIHKPTSVEKQSWTMVGIWRTNSPNNPNVKALFRVIKWTNYDGSSGFLGYYTQTGKNNTVDAQLKNFADNMASGQWVPVGWSFTKKGSTDICTKFYSYYLGETSYCSWYNKNPQTVYAPEIFTRWQATGILSNRITNADGINTVLLPITSESSYR